MFFGVIYGGTYMGMKKTILIVDDDRMNLVTAQKFLVEEYKVV